MSTAQENLTNTQGIQLPLDAFVVIISTEWNADIMAIMKDGCNRVLRSHEVAYKHITVPGAVELGFAVKKYWEESDSFGAAFRRATAFITLGCVIKGDTPHFDYVCKIVAENVATLNLQISVPTIFGVLTVNNEQEAADRLGGVHGHKGEEAAVAALKMMSISTQFKN